MDSVERRLTSRDLRQLFWRSFMVQAAFNFERMQGLGFAWTMLPLLKKLYQKKDDLVDALKRHLAFFNTHPWMAGVIVGIVASLEERKALRGEGIDGESIQAVKGGLMGPLAGIGDSLFFGTFRPVVAGVAVSLALTGNLLAPVLFVLVIGAVHCYVRWAGLKYGYLLGDRFLEAIEDLQVQRWMEGATIVGLAVLGALVATWLNVTTPLVYTVKDASFSIQEMLDGILPKALPLVTTLIVFRFLRKGVSATVIMFALVLVGLVGGYFNIIK